MPGEPRSGLPNLRLQRWLGNVAGRAMRGTFACMGRLESPISREAYENAFKMTVAALRDANIAYACMGSTALWALGGPQPNLQQDLDFAVCEEDVGRAAVALRDAGMFIQVPEEDWLFKAWTGDPEGEDSALVDLIFAPAGVHVTRELLEACEHRSVLALDVPVLSATDLIITKLHAINELNADYTSTLQFARSLREQVDWEQLDERVSSSPFGQAFMLLVTELGIRSDPDLRPHRPMADQRHATSRMDHATHRKGREELVEIARTQGAPLGRERRIVGPRRGPILGSAGQEARVANRSASNA